MSPTEGLSTVAAAVPRHLEEELKLGQTQQSRVQGPLLQQRKEATGSRMSEMKQSSCSFQRRIYQTRAGVDAIWT